MSERDVIELLAETRDWLREVQIGDAVPAIDTGIAEIASLRAEVERLRNGAPACCETVTDHDAAPATRADADRERPDNPPARPGDGTGDTPTLTDAQWEAVQICVERMQDSAVKSRRDAAATLRALLAGRGGNA